MQHDVLLESITENAHQDVYANYNTDETAEPDEVDIDSPENGLAMNA